MYRLQSSDISGNAVVRVMAAQNVVEIVDLFLDRQMPYLAHQRLQWRETAPQARFLGAHPNLKVAFQVARAVQGEAQKIDRLWAPPAVLTRVSLREPTELNELRLGRFQIQVKLSQSFAESILDTESIRSILEAHHKVIDVPHQGFAPKPRLN
jgi:hypothetical protein